MSPPPSRPEPRRSRRLWAGVGALSLVVLAIVVIVIAAAGGDTAQPAPLPHLHPDRPGPQSMFTPATELVTRPTETLDELQRLGVDQVHVYLHWADIAPDPTSRQRPTFDATDPAAYPAANWAIYDTIVRETLARGMAVILDLVPPPPAWASGTGAPDPATQPEWKPSAPEYGQFVRAAATRYGGQYTPAGATTPLPRVDFWSIWNEPNLGTQLAPEATDHSQLEVAPRLYRSLVNAAWTAFAATGHGRDTILIGEIAPAGVTSGVGQFNNMPPLRFLRALYCVDASYRPLRGTPATARACPATAAGSARFAAANPGLFHASGFADHPYSQGLPPDKPTPAEPDFAELAAIGKLERTLDQMQRVYGSHTRFPIYSTEYGYQTTPPDKEAGTVSPAQAAYYLNWSEYLTWQNPRLRTYDQYLLTDAPAGIFATGLKYANGTPKPGYDAYRMPIFLPVRATAKGHPLEVWGCARPVHFVRRHSHRRQTVAIQFRAGSSGAFNTVKTVRLTNRHAYFDVLATFPASGTVRLAWSYPDGPRIFSRAVAVIVR